MRRAGGTGSITKIKRDLRKPYRVTITERTYYDEEGKKHEKKRLLGYYETRKEAQEQLDLYNRNKEHINLDFKNIKFCDLWDKWIETKENDVNLKPDTLKGYKWIYSKFPDNIKNMAFVNIRFDDFQNMINKMMKDGLNYDTLRKARTSLKQLSDYAIKCDIVNVNYADLLNIGKSRRKGETVILTDEQIQQLMKVIKTEENKDTLICAKIILLLCFNGLRISEFLDLKTSQINLDSRIITISEAKTEAGDRRVPIHKDLYNYYCELYDEENEYFLINPRTKKKFSYSNFRDSFWDRFRTLMSWDEDLTPHNCRKTLASKLKKAGVDATYQKLILGHEGALDLTEKVYTYVADEQLIEAMDKIKIVKL